MLAATSCRFSRVCYVFYALSLGGCAAGPSGSLGPQAPAAFTTEGVLSALTTMAGSDATRAAEQRLRSMTLAAFYQFLGQQLDFDEIVIDQWQVTGLRDYWQTAASNFDLAAARYRTLGDLWAAQRTLPAASVNASELRAILDSARLGITAARGQHSLNLTSQCTRTGLAAGGLWTGILPGAVMIPIRALTRVGHVVVLASGIAAIATTVAATSICMHDTTEPASDGLRRVSPGDDAAASGVGEAPTDEAARPARPETASPAAAAAVSAPVIGLGGSDQGGAETSQTRPQAPSPGVPAG